MYVAYKLDFHDRHYDPQSGRFLSKDPKGIGGGDVNLYRYVGNVPVRSNDPFGLAEQRPDLGASPAWQDAITGEFNTGAGMTDITPTGFIKAVFAMPVIGALGSAVEVYGAISVLFYCYGFK